MLIHLIFLLCVQIGRSKWNGNVGNSGLVLRVDAPLCSVGRPSFSVQINSGIEFWLIAFNNCVAVTVAPSFLYFAALHHNCTYIWLVPPQVLAGKQKKRNFKHESLQWLCYVNRKSCPGVYIFVIFLWFDQLHIGAWCQLWLNFIFVCRLDI